MGLTASFTIEAAELPIVAVGIGLGFHYFDSVDDARHVPDSDGVDIDEADLRNYSLEVYPFDFVGVGYSRMSMEAEDRDDVCGTTFGFLFIPVKIEEICLRKVEIDLDFFSIIVRVPLPRPLDTSPQKGGGAYILKLAAGSGTYKVETEDTGNVPASFRLNGSSTGDAIMIGNHLDIRFPIGLSLRVGIVLLKTSFPELGGSRLDGTGKQLLVELYFNWE